MREQLIQELKDCIDDGLKSKNWCKVEKWLKDELNWFDDFPAQAFEEIICLLKRKEFLRSEKSFIVLAQIEYQLQFEEVPLTNTQKEILLSACEDAYPGFHDYCSQIAIVEMIYQSYDEDALKRLERLFLNSAKEDIYEVGLGICRMALDSPESSIRKKSRDLLVSLSKDKSRLIADRAAYFLKGIQNFEECGIENKR